MREVLLGGTLLAVGAGLSYLLLRYTRLSRLSATRQPKSRGTKNQATRGSIDAAAEEAGADIIINITVEGDWNWYFDGGPSGAVDYSVTITQIAPASAEKGEEEMAGVKSTPMKTLARAVPKPGGNGITLGGQGTFNAQLNNNGVPITIPGGSSWDWSDDDAASTITLDPTDPTGGTVFITVPTTDTSSTLTVTATTTDPDGNAVTGTLTVPLTPGMNMFTVTITQTA